VGMLFGKIGITREVGDEGNPEYCLASSVLHLPNKLCEPPAVNSFFAKQNWCRRNRVSILTKF
jgi:hypothetical protein